MGYLIWTANIRWNRSFFAGMSTRIKLSGRSFAILLGAFSRVSGSSGVPTYLLLMALSYPDLPIRESGGLKPHDTGRDAMPVASLAVM